MKDEVIPIKELDKKVPNPKANDILFEKYNDINFAKPFWFIIGKLKLSWLFKINSK